VYLLPNGNCPIATCRGNPELFLSDLSRSDFIHVTDQYTGTTATDRYSVERRAFATFAPPYNFSNGAVPFTDADIQAFVHAVVQKTGNSGYGHLYHVFLPPGTDECSDNTYGFCYSPDNAATFVFCSYHGFADFPDVGHVIYSVQPHQAVPGCTLKPGTPNGTLIDSTNDSLLHETVESITDPDVDAWFNNSGNQPDYDNEIADECVFLVLVKNNFYGNPGLFRVQNRVYAFQSVHNNARHGSERHCALSLCAWGREVMFATVFAFLPHASRDLFQTDWQGTVPACVLRYSATNRGEIINHRAGTHDQLHTIVDPGVADSLRPIDQLRRTSCKLTTLTDIAI
jgi:hypothetical protein